MAQTIFKPSPEDQRAIALANEVWQRSPRGQEFKRKLLEAVMPSKTPKQHRAMQAAAKGKSKIGIPRKVGREYVKADKRKARPNR